MRTRRSCRHGRRTYQLTHRGRACRAEWLYLVSANSIVDLCLGTPFTGCPVPQIRVHLLNASLGKGNALTSSTEYFNSQSLAVHSDPNLHQPLPG